MATTQPAYNSAENSVATAPSTDRFTDRLWAETKVLRESIDSLEFLKRLGDGTLPLDAFRTYIEQDKLYLEGYSKALSLVAAHAPDPQSAGFWSNSASTAATVESALHDGLLTGGILPAGSGTLEHSQACLGYVSYLTATAATAPYPVSAAAVLPCFWIYAEVGRDLAASAREVLDADPSHPYAQWVTTYDAPEFHESVAQARVLVDAAAEAATETEREAMSEAFRIASRYELMFWDSALHQQPWPAS
ncbi:TenA family protein [Rhodococcus erythropolis]|uniref:TenA family protein n=1 Tax=Rhodococcus erythropolis TaxID=1833 RepID=UPI000A04BA36|nr:TenA family protein [Rhodococcus erythropolis]ORI15603.1 TenA family transcriptional regulator [Rhodococcus erythropolis]OXM18622.1 TenA family transcriptional regulator [Rhodococcus erythropolis]QSE39452.1 TenA family protein [Rhodococcus erythropolis]